LMGLGRALVRARPDPFKCCTEFSLSYLKVHVTKSESETPGRLLNPGNPG
jgi:hypothetical protein